MQAAQPDGALKRFTLVAAEACGGFRLARFVSRRGLLVLTYHRVSEAHERKRRRPPDTVYADEFDRQVGYLKRHCHIVRGLELREFITNKVPLPPNSVLITFDDGYRNNYKTAFPILRRHDATALFFISTGFIDEPASHLWLERLDAALDGWPESALAQWLTERRQVPAQRQIRDAVRHWLKHTPADARNAAVAELRESAPQPVAQLDDDTLPMSWDQVREMAAARMTFGGHTVSHQILAATSVDRARTEVQQCRYRIESELQTSCWSFSYPNGEPDDFRNEDKESLREAGYLCAFTQVDGVVTTASDRYALPRVPVPDSGDFRVFQSRASGLYSNAKAFALSIAGR